jgi:hypothetical protein
LNHIFRAEDVVQQIKTLAELLPETTPLLAESVNAFSFDDSMGSLFSDTPEVIAVQSIDPPVAKPQKSDDRSLEDMSGLFIQKPPLVTPAPPPNLSSKPASLQNPKPLVDMAVSTRENTVANGFALNPVNAGDMVIDSGNYTETSVSLTNLHTAQETAVQPDVDQMQLDHAFESLLGPIGGITLPSENSRMG